MLEKSRFQQLAGILKESSEKSLKEISDDVYRDWETTQTADQFNHAGYSKDTQKRAAIVVHNLFEIIDKIELMNNSMLNLMDEVNKDIKQGVDGAEQLKKKLLKIRGNKELAKAARLLHDIAFSIEP